MITLHLDARRVFRWSALTGVVLIGLHVVVTGLRFTGRLDATSRWPGLTSLTGELNLPAWFSSMQLLLAAGLAAIIARRDPAPATSRGSGWNTLAMILVLHAIDEASGMHERGATYLPQVFGGASFAQHWLLVGGAIALALLAWFAPLLRRQVPEARRALLRAGAVYYGGAVVLHALAVFVESGGHSTRFLAVSTLEETAELLGVSLLLYALIRQQELAAGAAEHAARVSRAA
ncbi:MAG: hypothetical protein IT361_11990 [Gemmatimonadaceae bacterium]|nr:hypothetical protein [Gemmatimonadaceae bacterium]